MYIYKIKTSVSECEKALGWNMDDSWFYDNFILLTDDLNDFRSIIQRRVNDFELISNLYFDSKFEDEITIEELKYIQKPIFENIFCNDHFKINCEMYSKYECVIRCFSIMLTHLIVESYQDNDEDKWSSIGTYESRYFEEVYQGISESSLGCRISFKSTNLIERKRKIEKITTGEEL
ncbi:hypothetical protein AB4218_23190 [Vibrio splendidus]